MNNEVFEMYRDPDLVLPELKGLGWCSTDYPRFGGPRPDGRLNFEIGYLHRGSIEWMTSHGLEEAGPGSVVVDWPGDWQGGLSAIVHPCERYWVRFNFRPASSIPGLSAETTRELERCFNTMKSRHFPASPMIKPYFDQLIGQQREPETFAEEISRAAFHQILFTAIHDHDRDQRVALSPAIEQALALLDASFFVDFRVEQVAQAVGLSVGYFHELFVREIGIPPASYHQKQRIGAAKRQLITSDTSITELAMDLGYSSSQYFATAFKRVVGITPGGYRKLREASVANSVFEL